MATITIKQFFRNVFYIMLTLAATPYMLLSTFLSLFMDVPVVALSMEVYLPGYELAPKYEEEEEVAEESEHDEDDDSEEPEPDSEDDSESVKVIHTSPVLAPINVENHHDDLNTDDHCTPIPRHNSSAPESPVKRRATDIEDEIVIDSTARVLVEDFKNVTQEEIGEVEATLPTIDDIAEAVDLLNALKQEPSESFSSEVNDE